MSKLILAIDPGCTGAFALLDAITGVWLAVEDLPVIQDGALSFIDGSAFVSRLLHHGDGRVQRAVIERVSAMPKQGVTGQFNFGVAFGSILGALRVMQLPIELVSPVTWKRSYNLPKRKDVTATQLKHASLDKARLLYPSAPLELAKHHGRAEALLIGHWYLNRHEQRAAA